jgi:hypothetical protein
MGRTKKKKNESYFVIKTENVRFVGVTEHGVVISTCVANYSLDDGPEVQVGQVTRVEVTPDFVCCVMERGEIF